MIQEIILRIWKNWEKGKKKLGGKKVIKRAFGEVWGATDRRSNKKVKKKWGRKICDKFALKKMFLWGRKKFVTNSH